MCTARSEARGRAKPLCPPCWDALPIVIELSHDVTVVLVLLASHALSEANREKLREAGLRVVLDDEGELAQALAVRATPTYVILDGKGVIRWVREGVVELEEFRTAVLAILGEGGKHERDQTKGGV